MKDLKKTPRHTSRFLTHNENACKGRHCAECTPSANVARYRKGEVWGIDFFYDSDSAEYSGVAGAAA